jgi:LPXTG-motif cell wall-anchored protein
MKVTVPSGESGVLTRIDMEVTATDGIVLSQKVTPVTINFASTPNLSYLVLGGLVVAGIAAVVLRARKKV